MLRTLSLLSVLALSGCGGGKGPELEAENTKLKAELDTTKQKLHVAETELTTKRDEVAKAAADSFLLDANKKPAAEAEQAAAEKDTQLKALQTEVANLKKSDALVFADASATQRRGVTTIALDRYQQFIKNYPESAMVPHAERAIADLTKTSVAEAKARQEIIDPKRPQRDILKRFVDGAVTSEEIIPLLKNRTGPEIVNLLGKPSQTFRNGTELGYTDKVIDSSTGNKETLVIMLDGGGYATKFRLGYRGREIKP